MLRSKICAALLAFLSLNCALRVAGQDMPFSSDGNRLAYLDHPCDPYYVGTDFPILITPQWLGESGVEAVVVLAIDDMRDPKKYEAFLRPILERLKKIDGRAALSIMTNLVDPADEQLQSWLKEGLSIECHTLDHPCPLLKDGDFAKAANTYHGCVDLLSKIPGNQPVAFRMPCCDSLNTPSPRFFQEIFNATSPAGNYLRIDSSVFNVFTSSDKQIPGDLLIDQDGRQRFRKYIPFPSFVNTIENYPFPYVIANLCWQFPCVVPSDWEAQNLQQPNNPKTVEDMQAVLDLTVIKQGVFNLVFHPHGWIRNDQIVELIDYAVEKHGQKVKFLTFQEADERLTKNLLKGQSLRRESSSGEDAGVRILDINNDGLMDVVLGGSINMAGEVLEGPITRIWSAEKNDWLDAEFPAPLIGHFAHSSDSLGEKFGVLQTSGNASVLIHHSAGTLDKPHPTAGIWHFDGKTWARGSTKGLELDGKSVLPERCEGTVLRDLDRDGICELIIAPAGRRGKQNSTTSVKPAVFRYLPDEERWELLPFDPPGETSIVASKDETGPSFPDAGFRFVDLNDDGMLDIVRSNEKSFDVYLFSDMKSGWSIELLKGNRGEDETRLPMISRNGKNNGAFFHSRQLWVQNEDTSRLPDLVERLSFSDMLTSAAAENKVQTQEKNVGQPKAKSPAESLKSIKTRPELIVELVAAEPLIADPVAFDWAPDGSLWIVEMGDYPLGVDGSGKPGGRVRHLTDKDGDGKYDQSDLFLEDIPFPTGIKFWRDGVIVSTAPEIFLAQDTDKDGKSDKRTTLLSGFAEGNQQHRVNGLRWGLDGYLYLANGDSGGTITSGKTGEKIDIRGSDLKFNPDTGELISLFGQTQFGRDRDDWGNWVGGNNSNPMWQYMLDKNRLGKNENVAIPDVRHNVSDDPGAAPVFPLSETLDRFNDFDRANRFTSACSPMFYRDNFLGEEFYGNAFICEPVHNLVHREIVTREGLFLKSTRATDEQRSEFLASSDNWFRPTMIRTGPDGALWIADMYRLVIEHPEWIPAEWQQRLDLRSGHDMGRIYRVYRRNTKPKLPNIEIVTNSELIDVLKSSNGTLRDMAQQLLYWRGDASQLERIRTIALNNRQLPQARLQALWTLQMLEKPTTANLAGRLSLAKTTLEDTSPDIRAWAVQYSNLTFGDEVHAARTGVNTRRAISEVVQLLQETLRREPADTVKLEAAYSIGKLSPALDVDSLLNLLKTSSDNPYISAIILSNFEPDNAIMFVAGPWERFPPDQLSRFLAALVSADENGTITESLLRKILAQPQDFSSLHKRLVSLEAVLDTMSPHQKMKSPELNRDLSVFLETVRKVATTDIGHELFRSEGNDDEKLRTRIVAIGLLKFPRTESSELLFRLLASSEPLEIQTTALDTLTQLGTQESGERLLQLWPNAAPTMRSQMINAMIRQKNWSGLLLDYLEEGKISIGSLDAAQLDRLSKGLAEAERERLAKISPLPSSFDREVLIQDYLAALKRPGDATLGKAIFAKTCAACHRLGEAGTEIGPDLAALTDKSGKSLVKAILDPNAAVEQKYVNYIVETIDGLQHSGLLVQESSGSIKLLTADRKEVTLVRRDIESLTSNGKSFMPEGVEKDIDPPQMADLIAFLQTNIAPPKTFPNNQPETIRAEADGSYHLLASKARIYGPALVFEQQYKNLGFWSHVEDHADWTLQIKRAGKYRILLDYAVENGAAGDKLILQIGDQQIAFEVAGTGTWEDYVEAEIGEIELPAGMVELLARSSGPIKSALIDLREIKLLAK